MLFFNVENPEIQGFSSHPLHHLFAFCHINSSYVVSPRLVVLRGSANRGNLEMDSMDPWKEIIFEFHAERF